MMTSLAQLVASHLLLEDDKGNKLVDFDYREHCLQSVFWSIYSNLEQGKRSVLISDNQEDLEYIFYLLSRYKVHLLSLLINNKTKVSSTLQDKIKQDGNRQLLSQSVDASIYEKLIEYRDRVSNNIIRLKSGIVGSKSILDLQSLTQTSDKYQHQPITRNLLDAISHSEVQKKRQLYDEAQRMYQSKFQFLADDNPINNQTIFQEDRAAIIATVGELITEAEDLENQCSLIEAEVKKSIEMTQANNLDQIRDEVIALKTKLSQAKPYTATDISKLLYQESTLYAKLDIAEAVPAKKEQLDAGLARIEYALENRLATHYRLIKQKSDAIMAMLTPASSHSNLDIMPIIDSVNNLMAKVEDYDILKGFKTRKSTAFKFQRDNLLGLKRQLEFAKYFLEANNDYWEWLDFQLTLSDIDKAIIDNLKNQNGFWGDMFQKQYLGYVVDQQKIEIESVSDLTIPLRDALSDYINAHHLEIYQLWDKQKSQIKLVSDDWKFFLDENASQILDQYPVMVVNSDFYKSYGDRLAHATDTFFFLEEIPAQTYQHNTTNISLGFSNRFKEDALLAQKNNSTFTFTHNQESSYLITKKIENLPVADKNIAANYLGKKMRRLAPRHKIYQLRHLAIISFWSDKWNTQLLEQLSEQGIKEIISDNEKVNLIPATLVDADRTVHILLEDDLFDGKSTETIIDQHILSEELMTSGLTVKSLDNYKWMTTGDSKFSKIVTEIKHIEKERHPQPV